MTNRLKAMADNVSITLHFVNSTYFFYLHVWNCHQLDWSSHALQPGHLMTPPIKPSAATTRTNRPALTRPLHLMPSCVLKACLGLIMLKQGFSTHCKSTSFEPVCKLLSKIKGYILQCVSKNCAPSFILLRWPADNRQGQNDVTATCLVFKQLGVHFPWTPCRHSGCKARVQVTSVLPYTTSVDLWRASTIAHFANKEC